MSCNTLCRFYEKFSFAASWISSSCGRMQNQCLQFRKEFSCGHPAGDVILRIAAESYYRLYLNGQFIGQGPVRGSRTINFFDAYDLTGKLLAGDNCIAVEVQSMNEHENFLSYPAGCGVIAEIPGLLSTDMTWITRAAPEWICTKASYAFQQGYRTELDSGKCDETWKLCGYAPKEEWESAILFHTPELAIKLLNPRGIPALRESVRTPVLLKSADIIPEEQTGKEDIADVLNRELWKPSARIKKGKDNHFTIAASSDFCTGLIFDFGGSCSGFFELEIECEDQAQATITYGEELWNGRVRAAFLRGIHHDTFTDCYRLRKGRNFLTTPFHARGGNLVQITIRNTASEVKLCNPRFRERRYPHEYAVFECSDARLNRIWKMCGETLSVCTTDTFEDCPWRERSFWVNDFVVENAANIALFGPEPLQKHCIELLFSQQYPSGWVPGVIPVRYDEEKMPLVLAPANLFLFVIMHDYYLASGDMETLQKYLPNLERILETIESLRGRDGLSSPPADMSNLYDWGYELQSLTFNGCRETLFNSLYILAMKLYAAMSKTAGGATDFAQYESRIERIAHALRKNAEKNGGLLLDNIMKFDDEGHREPTQLTSELSLAFALFSGIWNPAEEQRFIDAICSGTLHTPDLYLQTPVMLQLALHGRMDEVLRRIRKYWGKFSDSGVQNFPEVGVSYTGRASIWDNTSLCHGFTSGPAVIAQRFLLGILPVAGGYERFSFAPVPGDLERAKGSVNTPHGPIFVSWKKKDASALSANLSIPSGCTCILKDGRTLKAGSHFLEITC